MTKCEKNKLEETMHELKKMLEIYECLGDRNGINEKTSCIKLMEYTLKCCGYKFITHENIYNLVSI